MRDPRFPRFTPRLWRIAVCVICIGTVPGVKTTKVAGSELRRTAVVKAVERVKGSVVSIHGQKTVTNSLDENDFGENGRRVNGMGTGVVIDPRGYIVTNYHVVEGLQRIQVTLADRRTFLARLVTRDPVTDLAIIQISEAARLPVIPIGTSSDLMPGEPVVAVGNAFGYDHTVTYGIVSALHRDVPVSDTQRYRDLIQTDASINPGNSGGPLLNIDGEMIGINVAVRVGAQGIGFAIPVDQAVDIAARLLSVERSGRQWHGVRGQTQNTDGTSRFVVRTVQKDSPAEKGGLRPGDVVTRVGSAKIERSLDFERAFLERKLGEEVPLTVTRGDKSVSLTLVTAAPPRRQPTKADRIWEQLGLRLEPIPGSYFRQIHSRYRGGLKITAVRAESLAARQGIRPGDVLVGMHLWETISLDNVCYVLGRPEFENAQPVKFYLLRGHETLYTHLPVAMRKAR